MSRSFVITAILVLAGLLAVGPSVAEDSRARKRVLHVDSYHRGNEWNDRIADAVVAGLKATDVDVQVVHMDTKRNPGPEFGRQAALEVMALIERWRPDVLTTSDDAAAEFLIAPHLKDADLPVVFCGLNWDASAYGLPFTNVTGMVEVSPIPQIVELLRAHAKGGRIGYLAEDSPTKRKELEHHERIFGIRYDKVWLAPDFAAWREAFLAAQSEVDMLVILGVANVRGWDDAAAAALAERSTRIPTGTDFEWLMHIAMLGVAKSPEEQGRWAARAALRILDGVPPGAIPVAYNTEAKLYFNPKIAARLAVDRAPPMAELVR